MSQSKLSPDNIEFLEELTREGGHRAWTTMELVHVHQGLENLLAEYRRLSTLINTPEIVDFAKAIQIEAAHQRERWGSEHDEGKTAADWFWLLGYLGGKAIHAEKAGDQKKLLHHIITTAAACCNWHGQVLGQCDMRPGLPAEKVQN